MRFMTTPSSIHHVWRVPATGVLDLSLTRPSSSPGKHYEMIALGTKTTWLSLGKIMD